MLLVPLLLSLGAAATPELVRESLTGTHYRFVQNGEEVNVTVRADGSREESRTPIRKVRREIVTRGLLRTLREIDPQSGRLIREIPLYYNAKPARVFDPNPVTALNDPSLEDGSDSASAVPEEAYRVVDLEELEPAGALRGPYVQITELQAPAVPPVDASQPLLFDRSASGFEDVNAYFHIDRSQRYLQSLGYVGTRSIARYSIPVDTHAVFGTDNSFYIASASAEGMGSLVFGEGGTDDAEDSDLVVHEYAHAIHESIAPGTFLGTRSSQARAVSEGFGDYWALAATYAQALASGRDPFCFADWDARCAGDPADQQCAYPAGADCLRRFDSTKTIADFVVSDDAGIEHQNGEIWASALREIFVALTARHGLVDGRRISDLIVIESLFGTPPNPSFEGMARRLIIADQYLNGGEHRDVICAAMTARGILSGCIVAPRGELTYFQSPARGVAIPDNELTGVLLSLVITDPRAMERLLVNVNIAHAQRGELRISLIAPDGTEVRLQNTSGDLTADIATTYGRETTAAQSLDVFRGRSAAGEWRLRVVDAATGNTGAVLSWSLVIQFAGDAPTDVRPTGTGTRQVIPIVGRTPGANGTFFMTDVRLLNRGIRETPVTLIFTPSGADGRAQFAAVNVVARPGELVAYDDIVGSVFSSGGTGQLEIVGDVIASSRIYTRSSTRSSHGEFGLSAAPHRQSVGRGEPPLYIPQLETRDGFRSNIGWAETAGHSGTLRIRLYETGRGRLFKQSEYAILPFTQMQIPVAGPGSFLAELGVISGDARLVGYGSIVDNLSGDPILIPAARGGTSTLIAPAISAAGVSGTHWRSDVLVTSVGTAPAIVSTVTLGFVNAAGGEENVSTFEIPGSFNAYTFLDAVGSYFKAPGARGTIFTNGDPGRIYASRVGTESSAGTFGQYVPFAVPRTEAVQDLLHVESSAEFRTNIGAAAGDGGAEIVITILDSAGNPLDSTRHSLGRFQLLQFQVAQQVRNGRARIEVLNGSVYAYASVVSNQSGDPFFVPAQ